MLFSFAKPGVFCEKLFTAIHFLAAIRPAGSAVTSLEEHFTNPIIRPLINRNKKFFTNTAEYAAIRKYQAFVCDTVHFWWQ